MVGAAVHGGGAAAAAGHLPLRRHVPHALRRAPLHGDRRRRALAQPPTPSAPSQLQPEEQGRQQGLRRRRPGDRRRRRPAHGPRPDPHVQRETGVPSVHRRGVRPVVAGG